MKWLRLVVTGFIRSALSCLPTGGGRSTGGATDPINRVTTNCPGDAHHCHCPACGQGYAFLGRATIDIYTVCQCCGTVLVIPPHLPGGKMSCRAAGPEDLARLEKHWPSRLRDIEEARRLRGQFGAVAHMYQRSRN